LTGCLTEYYIALQGKLELEPFFQAIGAAGLNA
jgi:hypothetical protein